MVDEVDRQEKWLIAGTLHFHINAGLAHVYCQNKKQWEELLRRKPLPDVQVASGMNRQELDLDTLVRNFNTSISKDTTRKICTTTHTWKSIKRFKILHEAYSS